MGVLKDRRECFEQGQCCESSPNSSATDLTFYKPHKFQLYHLILNRSFRFLSKQDCNTSSISTSLDDCVNTEALWKIPWKSRHCSYLHTLSLPLSLLGVRGRKRTERTLSFVLHCRCNDHSKVLVRNRAKSCQHSGLVGCARDFLRFVSHPQFGALQLCNKRINNALKNRDS